MSAFITYDDDVHNYDHNNDGDDVDNNNDNNNKHDDGDDDDNYKNNSKTVLFPVYSPRREPSPTRALTWQRNETRANDVQHVSLTSCCKRTAQPLILTVIHLPMNINRRTDMQTDSQPDRQAGRQAGRQADRQIDRDTVRQTERQSSG